MRGKFHRLGLALLAGTAALTLAGCISAVATIVTAPIKLVGAVVDTTVDKLTTSRDEADRTRGRKARKQDERDQKTAKKRHEAEVEAARDAQRRDRRERKVR